MSTQENIKALSLYHFPSCPFCAATRKVIQQTGLNIEQRDIQKQSQHRSALIQGGGKPQVPCLRIEKDDGQHLWLYESSDINHFLRSYAAQSAKRV
ncbi:glutaredoxin family protein [Neptunomonas antarctica]|uniref:Glutaredoxin n=1 Tax=Neptunomonas antarctica TaxID=619304 RepID=A0A1N7K0U1_9GAMM|nr:glutaredoxin [Neptunomonas antarctica]SIS55213.1 Glutaredoxin [Neptunomonas antarctica]